MLQIQAPIAIADQPATPSDTSPPTYSHSNIFNQDTYVETQKALFWDVDSKFSSSHEIALCYTPTDQSEEDRDSSNGVPDVVDPIVASEHPEAGSITFESVPDQLKERRGPERVKRRSGRRTMSNIIIRQSEDAESGCTHVINLKFVDLGWSQDPYAADIRLVIQTCNANRNGRKCNGRFAKPAWWDGATIDYSTLHQKLRKNGIIQLGKGKRRKLDDYPGASNKSRRKARDESPGKQESDSDVSSISTSPEYSSISRQASTASSLSDLAARSPSFGFALPESQMLIPPAHALPSPALLSPPTPAPPIYTGQYSGNYQSNGMVALTTGHLTGVSMNSGFDEGMAQPQGNLNININFGPPTTPLLPMATPLAVPRVNYPLSALSGQSVYDPGFANQYFIPEHRPQTFTYGVSSSIPLTAASIVQTPMPSQQPPSHSGVAPTLPPTLLQLLAFGHSNSMGPVPAIPPATSFDFAVAPSVCVSQPAPNFAMAASADMSQWNRPRTIHEVRELVVPRGPRRAASEGCVTSISQEHPLGSRSNSDQRATQVHYDPLNPFTHRSLDVAAAASIADPDSADAMLWTDLDDLASEVLGIGV
ncbi:hypothetical protein HDU93_006148 [Gonapodya sp. JEL0774]|nr:hypothetical protein HDU93_006148 [Gonapodya sp. JEL0774]